MRFVHGCHPPAMPMTQLTRRRIPTFVSSSILQSRWLLVIVAAVGIAFGVVAAFRLDDLVTPAAEFMIDD